MVKKDRIRNVDLRRTTGMKDAIDVAGGLKWQWGGHVARMQGTKWAYRTTPDVKSQNRQETRREAED
ncbi:hypothetical protein C0J52_12164 [Blattella germanica]|nr:hypothetical protein C0J52_12164 [Blattella germanica]